MTPETAGAPAQNGREGGDLAPLAHHAVTALPMTIHFDRDGERDHNGMTFAPTGNLPIPKHIEALGKADRPDGRYPFLDPAVIERAARIGVALPSTPAQAHQPHPLVRPLVLRARLGERVTVTSRNGIRDRHVGVHLVGGGYGVETDDGSHAGDNPPSLVAGPASPASPGGEAPFDRTCTWACEHEGASPFHDGGNHSGGEDGTNVHGLFGASIVEPPGTTWRDPVSGRGSHGQAGTGPFVQLDQAAAVGSRAGVRIVSPVGGMVLSGI